MPVTGASRGIGRPVDVVGPGCTSTDLLLGSPDRLRQKSGRAIGVEGDAL